jgi:hypothetical protein
MVLFPLRFEVFFTFRDTVTEHLSAPARPFRHFDANVGKRSPYAPTLRRTGRDKPRSCCRSTIVPTTRGEQPAPMAKPHGEEARSRQRTCAVRCAVSNHEAPAARHLSLILRDARKFALPRDEEELLPVNPKKEMWSPSASPGEGARLTPSPRVFFVSDRQQFPIGGGPGAMQ